jgi:hypothetical protein
MNNAVTNRNYLFTNNYRSTEGGISEVLELTEIFVYPEISQ